MQTQQSIMGRRWQRWSTVLALTSLLSVAGGAAAWAQAKSEALLRTLTVTGTGLEAIATTLTQVQLGVEAQDDSATAVRDELARQADRVVTFLRSRNVQKLETSSINIQPNYRYDNKTQQQVLVGYRGTVTVDFQVPNDQASAVLDGAVKAGANRINQVNFVASDAAIAQARQTALREATQDAQSQASVVLQTLNLTPKDIVSIQINNAAAPPPLPVRGMAQADSVAAAPPLPVVGGEQNVTATVTLQIQY